MGPLARCLATVILLLSLTCCIGATRLLPSSLLSRHAVAQSALQQARALLDFAPKGKFEDEPYGAVGAPDRFMYRYLAGSYLDFKSEAGSLDESKELCAKARHATACANRTPDSKTLARWSDKD